MTRTHTRRMMNSIRRQRLSAYRTLLARMLTGAVVTALILPYRLAAQLPTVRLLSEGNPAGALRLSSTGLLVTVDTDRALTNGALVIQAPKELGLTIRGPAIPSDSARPRGNAAPMTQVRIPLRQVAGLQSYMVDVHWLNEPRRKMQVKLIGQVFADLTPDSAARARGATPESGRILTQATIPIDVVRHVGMGPYFWVGMVGVLTGWILRILLFAQSKVPQPNPAPEGADTGGRVTNFVKENYYFVDAALALLLGALALIALSSDGNPPDKVDTKMAAWVFGVALGALTNSELLLKMRR